MEKMLKRSLIVLLVMVLMIAAWSCGRQTPTETPTTPKTPIPAEIPTPPETPTTEETPIGPLQISNVKVSYPYWEQPNTFWVIRIEWQTNRPADSQIEYGLTTDYEWSHIWPKDTYYLSSPMEPLVKHHQISWSIGFEDLRRRPGETYHFRVVSRDASQGLSIPSDKTPQEFWTLERGNLAVSEDYTFSICWWKLNLPRLEDFQRVNYSYQIENLTFNYQPSPSEIREMTDPYGNPYQLAIWMNPASKIVGSVEAIISQEMASTPIKLTTPYPVPEDLLPAEVRGFRDPPLAGQAFVQSKDAAIIAQAQELARDLNSQVEVVEKTVNWVNQNIEYKCANRLLKEYGFLWVDAVNTLKYRAGGCQAFAYLSIALLRAQGIPARAIWGIFADAGHTWIEVYYPDVGWVGYDPTNAPTNQPKGIPIKFATEWTDAYCVAHGDWSQKTDIEDLGEGRIRLIYTVTYPQLP